MKILYKIPYLAFLISLLQSQDDYSLEDINTNSTSYGDSIGISYFENNVVIHYFGHFYWGTCTARFGQLNSLYDDFKSQGLDIELVGIGKDSHLSSLNNWISGNSAPIVADESPFNVWNNWNAGQREMFITDLSGNIVFQENITSGIPDTLEGFLLDLLSYNSPSLCELGDVYVSEAHNSGDPEDYIEIYNSTNEDCSLEGFQLDDSSLLDDFTFGEVILSAGGYWVGYEDDDDSFSSGLSSDGDSVVFADPSGNYIVNILGPSEEFEGTSLTHNFSSDGEACYSLPSPGLDNEECIVLKVDNNSHLISTFTLFNNYPNPFNPKTTFQFSLEYKNYININIINLKGHEVKKILSKKMEPGIYSITWNATDNNNVIVPSGVYFYKVQSGAFHKTKKMILIK